MDALVDTFRAASAGSRVVLILLLALAAHLAVVAVRWVGTRLLTGRTGDPQALARRKPKAASVITLVVSALTFVLYFGALGLILGELGISLTAYFASATVIGLAIGFGSQGLVQDIVIGLTLIFSDVLDVGDVADIGGQTGRVESIGLRFTTLRTLLDQRVVVPNRNVGQINRYRNGYVRAYLDVQLPASASEEEAVAAVDGAVQGMAVQHGGVILRPPESLGVHEADPGGWRYLRTKIHLWPGQGPLVETTLRQRVLAAMKKLDPDYQDWMVTVTWRVGPERRA